MNIRQYRNQIPDILIKTEELMGKKGVPVRNSWQNCRDLSKIPDLYFVVGEEYRLIPVEDGSLVMEVGQECVDDKRLDPLVYLLTMFLHDDNSPMHLVELSARFVQIAYRFKYNQNSVKGLFFYCKINNIKHGEKHKEAIAMASSNFTIEGAEILTDICKGIIV
jgi:hypothetical protein